MGRLFLYHFGSLRWRWWRLAALGLVVAAPFLLYPRVERAFLPGALVFALSLRYGFYFWRFRRQTRAFQTFSTAQLLLRYAPSLEGTVNLPLFVAHVEQSLSEMRDRFGFPLKRQLLVFLFAKVADLTWLAGRDMAAGALIYGDAILVAADSASRLEHVQESVRHELAHLFSAYWAPLDPPFKGEGLATCLERSIRGRPIDFHALSYLLGSPHLSFFWLLKARFFYRCGHWAYALAGSFTGFLIRRFGWEAYQQFFRRARKRGFERTFEKIFGVSLSAAERQWRTELVARCEEFEPELDKAVRERQLETAYNTGLFLRCVQETEAIIASGNANARVLWLASAAHTALGNYAQAAKLMEQVLQKDEVSIRLYRARAYLDLGKLHDLLGNRGNAKQAYRQALAERDWQWRIWPTTHFAALRYLRRPFIEEQLQRKWAKRAWRVWQRR